MRHADDAVLIADEERNLREHQQNVVKENETSILRNRIYGCQQKVQSDKLNYKMEVQKFK